MKPYLATTAISEIWDQESDLLLLGPWCLSGKDDSQIKDYTLIPSPWKPAIKIKEAADYCYQVYLEILPRITKEMNNLHNAAYPIRYWDILLGPWLLHFIGIIYDRYVRMNTAIRLFPDLYTHALPQEQCDISSLDTLDCFRVKVVDDSYNLRLFSLINYEIHPQSIIETTLSIPAPKKYINEYRYNWRAKIFNYLVKDFLSRGSIMLVDMYHLRNFDKLFLKFSSGFNKIGFMDFVDENKSILNSLKFNEKLRRNINLGESNSEFHSLLHKIIPRAMPICYIEGYKTYSQYIDNMKNIDKVKILGSPIGWYYNEIFKFFAAKLVLNNAKLIDFQHGGGYSIYLSIVPETISLEKDIFYVWGMDSEKQGEKIKYLPSPYLSKIKDSHSKRNDYLLFIGVPIARFILRFSTYLQPEDAPKYLEDKKLFLDSLNKVIRDKILYRPYPSVGWEYNEEDFIRQYYPNINFLFGEGLIKWMQRVKMVIIDQASTSMLAALTINVPCIFYWDHDVYLMREDAEHYFNLLRNAGIVFKDPISAAKKVNEISDSAREWWLSSDIQNARQEFCRRYAYAKKDWQKIWVKELLKEIKK